MHITRWRWQPPGWVGAPMGSRNTLETGISMVCALVSSQGWEGRQNWFPPLSPGYTLGSSQNSGHLIRACLLGSLRDTHELVSPGESSSPLWLRARCPPLTLAYVLSRKHSLLFLFPFRSTHTFQQNPRGGGRGGRGKRKLKKEKKKAH